MKLKCNCCDGIYNSFDVHFTSACDNKCAHCVDNCYNGLGIVKPNIDKIVSTIKSNLDGLDDVLFLGGEPCLYLDLLVESVKRLRNETKLKLYVTTSVPKICYDNKELFYELIDLLDGINLSVQHYDETIADLIRRSESKYNRQSFYSSLPNKNKIRINLNIVKPFLYTKEDLTNCLIHYDNMGFSSIKLSEIQHGKDVFVSFAEVFGLKMKSPYSYGCQSYLNMNEILPGFKTPVLLKRSCFLCEDSLKATLCDGLKAISKIFRKSNNKYGVVYEDGTLKKGWV
jgi:pyruvate-formate lyase-activating enzyme